jgi:Uma2 family endonuclease
MLDGNNLVNKILEQPAAALIIKEVQQKLKDEQQKRQEFYKLIGEDDKAEFVNGEIIFHSPVMKAYTESTKLLLNLLDNFVEEHSLGWVGVEKTMTQFSRNDYEPDICFFGNEKAAKFEEKQLLYPIPDFIVEILSKSNKKNIDHDRVTKYKDYDKHGVKEYWIIDPHEKTVEQYLLKNEEYELILKSSEGIIHSQVVTHFNIPILAIFDSKINRSVLRQILAGTLPK